LSKQASKLKTRIPKIAGIKLDFPISLVQCSGMELIGKLHEELVELNEIMGRWMAIQSNAPEEEKRKLFKEMDKFPKSYLSVSSDGKRATPMHKGSPCLPDGTSMYDALGYCTEMGIQTTYAWQNSRWVSLPHFLDGVECPPPVNQ
jgi:hypothetical protein